MQKLYEKFGEVVRHNVPLAISICLVVLLLFFASCESKTQSLTVPNVKVTRDELKIEYETEMARLEQEFAKLQSVTQMREKDLDRQDAFRQKLFEIGRVWAETGSINPMGMATSLIALLSGGLFMNGLVKDRIIKTQGNEAVNRVLSTLSTRESERPS